MKVGILGGGQLARMLAISAIPLDIEIICIDPNTNCSAKQVTRVMHCDLDDVDKIDEYFHNVDCITYETENLPIDSVNRLANKYKILPNIKALEITQDRLYEKNFFSELNIPTVEYFQVETWSQLKESIEKAHFPVVLKTRRNGYDGKGQIVIKNWDEAKKAWELMQEKSLIIEKFIPYNFEVSLISVRNSRGEILFYPLVLNKHKNGILRTSEAPYINMALQNEAQKYAVSILEKFNYIGVMTIEFFCLNDTIIANEIAPRVHNSGHWTIEGAKTSQFENHLRAIVGLPLESTEVKAYSLLVNLLGNVPDINNLLKKFPNLHFYDYQKSPRKNRKVGHLTFTSDHLAELEEFKKTIKNYLDNDYV